MKLLRNLSIKTKLILVSLIPLVALVFYLQINISRENNNKTSAQLVMQDAESIEQLSLLIHEIQKERALTLTWLASESRAIREQLEDQWANTDMVFASASRVLKNNTHSKKGFSDFDKISVYRSQLDRKENVSSIDSFYLEMKIGLLDGISDIVGNTTNPVLRNMLEEHLFLLYAKDFLAGIRSELSEVLTRGKFENLDYGNFASLKGKHEINLRKLKRDTSHELKGFINKKYQGSFVDKTYLIIESAYRDPSLAILNYTADEWWSASTSSINILKEAEDYSNNIIREKAGGEVETAKANLLRSGMIALVVVALILLIGISTIREITGSIQKIRTAAERIAKGDLDHKVQLRTRDELGELGNSFNKMIASTKEFSLVAEQIGKGDYSSNVSIRSEGDKLGNALHLMKLNLEKLSEENARRTWLLTGNSELNTKLRGEKEVKTLAQETINFISNYLKAHIGAIYLSTNGSVELVGSYAYHYRKNHNNSFKPGQGLVGQSLVEKKTIVFSDVPEDYIQINSGLGKTFPRNILVFPFLYEGEVKGIIELGSIKEFSEVDLEFLELVGENVAIAFNTAESRSKMKDLLEETQRQAEELEVQQEELKQSNEELHVKTDLLERSEAELKTQQEELQQTNEELEEKANLLEAQKEKLEQAKIDIENKARELEATSRYKSEFLANMSHELRTPLNSILILSQLLSENKNNVLREKEMEFAKNIYNSGTDLLHLINEILDLSKVESGKMELDISELAISDISSELRSLFSEVARNKSIDFQIRQKDDVQLIKTDKQRLQQVLKNLLSNAFKFTGMGGNVTLDIRKAPGNTRYHNEKLQHRKDIIAFSVKDNGIGIPEDKLAIVFEAFQQADGSTKRKYGGTGLGLSISRELANFLGGEIHVTSEEGQGSTFTLFLPGEFQSSLVSTTDKTVEIKPKEPLVDTPHSSFNTETEISDIKDDRYNLNAHDKLVLIMEDDRDFAKVLLDFIRERNYKGIIATQGNTGLSYTRHYKPDAILLDMKLPVMEGNEVLKHLKNDPQLRHIPVQIISGYDNRKEGLELGAFDFIKKPVLKEDLQKAFDKIEDFINKKLKKLLIVEDNKNQNKAIRELVGDVDVKIISAYSGEEGFELMKNEGFDCVIIDLGLPDMSGFTLMEKIKSDASLKKVPIVVYTGKDLTKEENSRLSRLANTVVLKTADSKERLLDETMLFLHKVESRLPIDKQNIIRKLHKTDEVLKGKKILVVDDDIRNIYSLTNALEEEGMICVTAENGKMSVKALKNDPSIEMVLMDVMMPEMDGIEATRQIRGMEKFNKLPIIALTAKAMKGDREKCLSAGMSDYISKPVNIEQLLSLMRVWLYQ